jgi:hypothetical protein
VGVQERWDRQYDVGTDKERKASLACSPDKKPGSCAVSCENNGAVHGKTEMLYQPNNGNFLGLIELLAKFDPTM